MGEDAIVQAGYPASKDGRGNTRGAGGTRGDMPDSQPPLADPSPSGSSQRRRLNLPPPTPPPQPGALADALDGAAEPTDDAPTIISKKPPSEVMPAASDLRGRRLAHFELIEQIGAGGMAAVLKARDTQLDRDVALKILPPDMAQ